MSTNRIVKDRWNRPLSSSPLRLHSYTAEDLSRRPSRWDIRPVSQYNLPFLHSTGNEWFENVFRAGNVAAGASGAAAVSSRVRDVEGKQGMGLRKLAWRAVKRRRAGNGKESRQKGRKGRDVNDQGDLNFGARFGDFTFPVEYGGRDVKGENNHEEQGIYREQEWADMQAFSIARGFSPPGLSMKKFKLWSFRNMGRREYVKHQGIERELPAVRSNQSTGPVTVVPSLKRFSHFKAMDIALQAEITDPFLPNQKKRIRSLLRKAIGQFPPRLLAKLGEIYTSYFLPAVRLMGRIRKRLYRQVRDYKEKMGWDEVTNEET